MPEDTGRQQTPTLVTLHIYNTGTAWNTGKALHFFSINKKNAAFFLI